MSPTRIGFLGCGNVSRSYVESARIFPDQLEIVACADVNRAAAEQQADRYDIPRVHDPDTLLRDADVDLIVNLTPPDIHADLTLAAIAAGKHVYSEKPLAPTLELADKIVSAAREKGVSVGCAPATFLGGGLQTSRKLIDDGWIGTPLAATAFFTNRGYEHWHPNVNPYYGFGGGPMLDLGPYLITTLISFFGPVHRVSGSTRRFSESRPRPNAAPGAEDIPVEVSTHAAGTIDFVDGPIVTVITSWEMWATKLPFIEIYGTAGTLSTPDPDVFTGTPVVRRGDRRDLSEAPYPPGGGEWTPVPMSHRGDVGRAIGVADMADALSVGRPIRADMELAYHVLEVMLAFDESSQRGEHIQIASQCLRPAALPSVGPHQPVLFS